MKVCFRFLRTGLSGFAEADIDFLENYVLARGIRGASRWKKKFLKTHASHRQDPRGGRRAAAGTGAADQLRERFWKQIAPFYEIASGQEQTVAELTRGLYEFLTELQLEEQIHQAQELLRKPERNSWHLNTVRFTRLWWICWTNWWICWEKKYFPSGIMQMFWKKGLRRQKSVRFRREQTV